MELSFVANNAARYPDKTALVFEGGHISYSRLAQKTGDIAGTLQGAGVGPGDIVPIITPRGLDAVCALLGVLRAGAGFCFVSPDYPPERVDFILNELNAKVTLDEGWLQSCPGANGPFADVTPGPGEPAIVVYTSGSTGSPKGVVAPFAALQLALLGNVHGRTGYDVFLSTAAFSFIAVVMDVLTPLSLGATLHIASDTVRRDSGLLEAYCREHGVTTAFMPPQMLRSFLLYADGLLRVALTGSEKVRGIFSEKTQVINIYGASETCGPVTGFAIDQPYEEGAPIGHPYEGSGFVLLDEAGAPAPPGEVGEICVWGQIATGYLNRPELTADRFIQNPLATSEQDRRIYRTGDLGRLREDGALLYLQRSDWMVKVRGYRVEPGEVESAITRHTGARAAVVKGFENALGETSLFAVYTADEPLPPDTVREAIRAALPDYMMPAFFEQVDKIPVNPNGKVDRKNIAPPDAAKFLAPYEPPANEREGVLCAAFAEVLGLDRVGALDDFNLLGGDSISAARVQAALASLGVSASDILSLGTPRKLAALEHGELEKAKPREEWPLTFAERQMATEQAMNEQSVAYNINLAFEVEGALDIAKLQAALDGVLARHAILRSFYPMKDGEITHRIKPTLTVPIEVIPCKEAEVNGAIFGRNTPFNLAAAPLLRCHLFATGKGHVLHLCVHHIILDGAGGDVLISDLWSLYNGRALKPLEFEYTDFAVWQQAQGEDAHGKAFFEEMFAGGPPENEMPTHATRPGTLPVADVDIERLVPAGAIDRAAKEMGVSAYTLLMAATGLTLAKYCASEDIVLGTAMSGRTLAAQQGMMGMFVNTLPIRLRPAAGKTVAEFVREAADTIRGTKAHQTYPFEQLVPLLAPDRNAARNPVFDVMVNYLQEMKWPEVAGLTIRRLPIKGQALQMDLMLEALREGGDLRLVLSYSRSLYQDEVAQNFMEQLLAVLQNLTGGAREMPLAEAAALPQGQRRQILEDFAGGVCDDSFGQTVVGMFRDQAARTPGNKAVVYDKKILTYAGLDNLTDRLACHLAGEYGLGAGGVAGIIVHRSELMPLAALAVLKTGAAYMPLDPAYPADRLEFMLEDSGAKVLIADRDLEEKVPRYGGAVFFAEQIEKLPALSASSTLPAPPAPEDLLILLYTSGTTGNPKGVMLTHDGLASYITWYAGLHHITETDNIPAYASFGFDANMMDMYPTLTKGACLHIIPEEMRLDLDGLNHYFTENNITVAFMTTQLGRAFAEGMDNKTLRALSVGGEALVPLPPPQNFDLYNVYGPTECTIVASYFKVDKLYDRVPIGRAVDNTALYVVDASGSLSPVGVPGELCIAGRQVAKGYLNRPDLTEEKFVENPFSERPDYARMYKTGDVVRFLPDGNIDFVGRRDFQVKIRGFRVELTEIEARIREFPLVADAAVIPQDDPSGGKRVVAYIVSDETVDIKALNAFILDTLPPYMVPAATMQIEAIPLNQNGKVNRRALPPIQIQAEEVVAPKTDLQRDILEVVSGLIGGGFGITTDLMYAGLNSLSAIKAAALISDKTGKTLSTRQLMREKTVERVAALLEKSEASEGPETFQRQDAYPLTQNQLGLYFSCIKDPGTLVYNIPFEIRLPAGTDAERLAACVGAVLDAHSYVKTRFALRDNQPMQQRQDDEKIDIPVEECSDEQLEKQRADFVRPFNFFEGHLLRVEIYKTPSGLSLLCDFHHIIFDGGSMDIFLRDLAAAWRGEELAPETFTSYDLALQEQAQQGSEAQKRAGAYFESLLADGEGATQIPQDHKSAEPGKPHTVYAYAPSAGIDAAAKGRGITAANHFLAAALLVTGRFASTRDVRIAAIYSGREGAELQNNFGMLVKTLPLVAKADPAATAADYCDAVQGRMFDAIDNRIYSYMQIASDHHFDAQILYAYQGGVISEYSLGDAVMAPRTLGLDVVKFPININVFGEAGRYRLEVEYDDAMWEAPTMQAFADCLAEAAARLAREPQARLGDIGVATKEQRAVVQGFNGEIKPNNTPALHLFFEEAAAKTPDKTALYAADAALTYSELDKRANRLANALLAKGLCREDRIAFILPRDSRVLVSMLGVMKAGGCYIPIDPEYPRERIEHILEDSGARFILAEKSKCAGFENGLDIDELLAGGAEQNPHVPVRKEDLCYIIYTSGSTGRPKGVMISHGNIINYVLDEPGNRQVRALVKGDCAMCSVTTVSFDMFLKESYTTLMNGLTLVFADDEQSKNPLALAALFHESGATAFNATPSRMMQYLEVEDFREALKACKVVMAGGEKYPPALYNRLSELLPEAVLINTYGPTETTVSCNGKVLTGPEVTIGGPLHNVVEQVMDIEGQPLPAGAVGELYIGGEGVARGYFGNEAMTAERFIQRDGLRYYKSGDLARWTSQGEIALLGRNDGQIKLRGLRIELGEIENAIGRYEGILSNAVVVRALHGQEHLCAYYTAERPIDPEALRDALLKTLTRYMVPTAYLQMEKLPTTPNGKTDTKALPEARLLQREEYVPPAGPDEEKYCDIFKKILHLERVGATDNFFDLGGTSLLVTQLTIDAMEAGFAVSYGDIFASPTPRELAALHTGGQQKAPAAKGEDYDYGPIHNLLNENTLQSYLAGEAYHIGNLCLTGATGFLGIHVLKAFLESEKGAAYCVVRGGKTGAEKRLKSMLVYYFSDSFDALFGSRIIPVEGDITSPDTFKALEALPINTLINCAANVKHFSSGTDIEDINVGGVANGVAFAKAKGCRFIQVSTASVAGMNVDAALPPHAELDERMLFFGQDISNQYVHSKFLAERLVLEGCLEGLDGKIMRVGNLMARASDGEFQANFNTNSFLGKLRAYQLIGKIAYGDMGASAEFAPIDCTADAILRLARTPKACRVFHPFNDHDIFIGDVIHTLSEKGIDIQASERPDYDRAYGEALRDQNKAQKLNALVAYSNMAHGRSVAAVKASTAYTSQILLRLGFKWPLTSDAYLGNFIEMMKGLGFFDETN